MKTKRLLFVLGMFSLLLGACEEEAGKLGESKEFWAVDLSTNRPYSIEAEVKAEGEHCIIWVAKNLSEKGIHVADSTLSRVVSEYDKNIRPELLKVFSVRGSVEDPDTRKVVAQNSLEWADYLGDGDKKLSILILDIPGGSEVAGYFMPLNFYAKGDPRNPDSQFSNETDMVYMNASQLEDLSAFYSTLAHETQHLMNFANSVLLRRYHDQELNAWNWQPLDLWIDEGLASAAEYVYTKEYIEFYLHWFNNIHGKPSEMGSKISEGNNFFVWGERRDAIMDEYATVYFFFQWLRLQAGGDTNIYHDIATSKLSDHNAVVEALQGKGNYRSESNLSWGTLLRDWLVANRMTRADLTQHPRGTVSSNLKYSYMKDPLLSRINPPSHPSKEPSVYLYPGEGVYSYNRAVWSKGAGDGPNIRYAGLHMQTGQVTENTSPSMGVLISYNINTQNEPVGDFVYMSERLAALETLKERARIATDAPHASSSISSLRMNNMVPHLRADQLFSKPPPISIWDTLRLYALEDAMEMPVFKRKKALQLQEN